MLDCKEDRPVWYVQGEKDVVYGRETLWTTKEGAEAYARELFPDESVERRYARIYYRNVWSLK